MAAEKSVRQILHSALCAPFGNRTQPEGEAVKPLCRCGCGQRVKRYGVTWATYRCVPHSIRSEGAKKGRRRYALKMRAKLFYEELARLDARVTREDLLAVFMDIYQRGWDAGYHTCDNKYRRKVAA